MRRKNAVAARQQHADIAQRHIARAVRLDHPLKPHHHAVTVCHSPHLLHLAIYIIRQVVILEIHIVWLAEIVNDHAEGRKRARNEQIFQRLKACKHRRTATAQQVCDCEQGTQNRRHRRPYHADTESRTHSHTDSQRSRRQHARVFVKQPPHLS